MTSRKSFLTLCPGIVLIGVLVRVAALFNEFWFDEIRSWMFARSVRTPLEIFTSVHSDNNHILNTLFLYVLGEQHSWIVYRLPSLIFGVAVIVLAGLIASRQGRDRVLTTLLLFSTSYFMILYSSEARGYMPAVFFALLSFLVLDRAFPGGERMPILVFSMSSILGVLSHLTFLFAYIAMGFWSLRLVLRRDPLHWDRHMLWWYGIPTVSILLLTYLSASSLQILGGWLDYPIGEEMRATITAPFGVPASFKGAIVCAVLFLLILYSSLIRLHRERVDHGVFFMIVLFLPAAAMALFAYDPGLWYPRYALVPMAFFLLLMSDTLCSWKRQMRYGLCVYSMLLILFVALNAWNTGVFLLSGRGRSLEALRSIVSVTKGESVTVTGDSRATEITVAFYAPYLKEAKRVTFVSDAGARSSSPEWFIKQAKRLHAVPEPTFTAFTDVQYNLMKEFRYTPLLRFPVLAPSGIHWFIYQRAR